MFSHVSFCIDIQIQWFTKYNKSLATYMRTVGLDLTQVITIIMACLVKEGGVLKKSLFSCAVHKCI